MLYNILKIPAKFALYFYCRKIQINNPEALKIKGPLILASNHPNSFLDAIILATHFNQPIYSLARGDAFANHFFSVLLRSLNILPVYRQSEGIENLGHNYTTFNECLSIFKKSGAVLIFSEGRCINEWHLRPLKKGTARLAINAWRNDIPLTVLPVGINYSAFRLFGKNVIINFGKMITSADVDLKLNEGRAVIDFNLKLNDQLKKLVLEIDENDRQKLRKALYVPQPLLKKILLLIPSTLGWLLHFPIYRPIELLIRKRANDHFDSIILGLLFVIYPFYLLLFFVLAMHLINNRIAWLVLILLPFTAWSCLQTKKQLT